jgi:hypothetical protein
VHGLNWGANFGQDEQDSQIVIMFSLKIMFSLSKIIKGYPVHPANLVHPVYF